MSAYEIPLTSLSGEPLDLRAHGPKGSLIVNVASECGLTPQYEQLQALHDEFHASGFGVVGAPCNQFGGQEPGTPDEIAAFCTTNYSVTFPLTEKLDVNGEGRHPLFAFLAELADGEGEAGDIQWNFEKFLVDGTGQPVARFRPGVTPDDPALRAAITRLVNGG